ncbi:hypothetical protein GE21DRAFT_1349745 [Neurospora crassa]|uniref:Uncharacterized protein n=1 Tax=Neurospora crassa (strain ATCC 24698 / 74-OR23-1A / CBS 708.71 / DSM 1257 / FGSC 987) TaxID=367110 RepID=Q7SDL2_NEUCR|nr:hypothetical protein NCU00532 [Neurospora crassa OR74A]EAA34848.1 hypothetical protein NCU00532 [Neurospora crassa OR74A]KHE85113.1 hypothetical protein GE21DRAFT_1349745 [Neurospora crassa]|eukprot:XP_964084.1 hypothetical protein NCU00532 [Neurospora crassa OR74A]
MPWIDFERDWSYQWPLVWQAKSLVDHCLATGADTHALLVEQRCLREAQTNLSISWMFYNAVVVELEGRL